MRESVAIDHELGMLARGTGETLIQGQRRNASLPALLIHLGEQLLLGGSLDGVLGAGKGHKGQKQGDEYGKRANRRANHVVHHCV